MCVVILTYLCVTNKKRSHNCIILRWRKLTLIQRINKSNIQMYVEGGRNGRNYNELCM